MATLRVAAKPEAAVMMVAQISKPGGEFELVERQIPEPGAGEVRIENGRTYWCVTASAYLCLSRLY